MARQVKNVHIPLDIHTNLKVDASKREIKLSDLIAKLLENSLKEIDKKIGGVDYITERN